MTIPFSDKSRIAEVTFTIASGQTTSNAVNLAGCVLMGLVIPTLTSTTLTPQLSQDDINFYPVCDPLGAAQTINATASENQYVFLAPTVWGGGNSVKLVGNTMEGSARTITGFTRALS